MIKIHLSPGDVARVRFFADPAWNVCASLSALVFPSSRSLHRGLANALAEQQLPGLEFLRSLTTDPRWPSSVLTPHDAADVPGDTDDAEVRIRRAVRQVPDRDVAGDLAQLRVRGSDLGNLSPTELRQQSEEALVQYWSTVLKPFWEMAQSIVTQDLATRGNNLVSKGLYATLNSLSPKINFTGTTLELDHPMEIEQDLRDGHLAFIPVVFHCPGGFIAHGPDEEDPPGQPVCIAYPALGLGRLGESHGDEQESPFTRLLGATRARVLAATELASTTSGIADRLDLPAATINGHLTILADSGFLVRSRRGKYVYYQVSPAGRALIQSHDANARRR